MTRTFQRFPDRAAWLEARRRTIGGSDAAAILGVGFRTPLAVQQEKLPRERPSEVGPTEAPPDDWNLRFATGSIMEPVVAREAEIALSLPLVDPGANGPVIYYSEALPHGHCTPDRFALRKRPGKVHLSTLAQKAVAVVSLKTWNGARKADWEGAPPLYALIQLQHEMLITGVEAGVISVVGGAGEWSLTTPTIEPHEGLWRRLQEEIPAWWERHIVRGEPCSPVAADVSLMNSLYPTSHKGSWIYLGGPEWVRSISKLEKIKRLQSRLGEMRDGIEASIKATLGETETLVIGDGSVAVKWATETRNEAPREARVTTVRKLRVTKTPKDVQNLIASGATSSAGELTEGRTEA